MANRRMFSKDITNSEEFLEMPDSTQKLYFHLGMNADDDGFVQPKGILRLVRSGEDDLKVLKAKGFIIEFNDNVIVITAWKINNEIRLDRYKPTIYKEHLKSLGLTENKAYIKDKTTVVPMVVPLVDNLETQVRLGKVRLGKVRLERTPAQEAISFFNGEEVYQELLTEFSINNKSDRIVEEFKKFILFWTEKNKTGTKERWEHERTFEVKRRLFTWFSRSKDFKGGDITNKYQIGKA